VHALLTDLDHTLFDWTRGWASATRGLLAELRGAGLAPESARRALRTSYRRHQTMDCAAALEELVDIERFGGGRRSLRRAAQAYRIGWQQGLRRFSGVRDTLSRIRRRGCVIVGFTESPPVATAARLALTGLGAALDLVVCTSRDVLAAPDVGLTPGNIHRETRMLAAPDLVKGTPGAVATLLAELRLPSDRLAVVGDHLDKDIRPACQLGLNTAWASYGAARDARDYQLVLQTCHWTDAGGQPRAASSVEGAVRPRILRRFEDLLAIFDWRRDAGWQPSW
jgi:phosphoglycolate phosphatase